MPVTPHFLPFYTGKFSKMCLCWVPLIFHSEHLSFWRLRPLLHRFIKFHPYLLYGRIIINSKHSNSTFSYVDLRIDKIWLLASVHFRRSKILITKIKQSCCESDWKWDFSKRVKIEFFQKKVGAISENNRILPQSLKGQICSRMRINWYLFHHNCEFFLQNWKA